MKHSKRFKILSMSYPRTPQTRGISQITGINSVRITMGMILATEMIMVTGTTEEETIEITR
jgi:hypothetical protein